MFNKMMTDTHHDQSHLKVRLWTPKPDYVEHFSKLRGQILYTDSELVDAFIATTDSWYKSKSNILYGWQDEIRIELIRCLKENKQSNSVAELIYAEMKFSTEWIGTDGMFLEYHPKRT